MSMVDAIEEEYEDKIEKLNERIKALEAGQLDFAREMEKILKAKFQRIQQLEAGLRNILYESKSKAYSPTIVQSYAEQALKG